MDNQNSDLDLVLTTFENIFGSRKTFYQEMEKVLVQAKNVSEVFIIWGANVPLCKFKVGSISIDLVYVELIPPNNSVNLQYFESIANISTFNTKSIECLNSYLMMVEMRRTIEAMDQVNPDYVLQIFSRVTSVLKHFAQTKGIYSYKMGYLNGISIMIMVLFVMIQVYSKRKDLTES